MVDGLNSLRNLQVGQGGAAGGVGGTPAVGGAEKTAEGQSFKDVLMKNLGEVNKLQQESDQALENYVTGKSNNMGEVISASQKASLAFSMLVQIRNKLQESYDELKNLRV